MAAASAGISTNASGVVAAVIAQARAPKGPQTIKDVYHFPDIPRIFTKEECEEIRNAAARGIEKRLEDRSDEMKADIKVIASPAAAFPPPSPPMMIHVNQDIAVRIAGSGDVIAPPAEREAERFNIAPGNPAPVQQGDAVYLDVAAMHIVNVAAAAERTRSNRNTKTCFCCLCLVIAALVTTLVVTHK